jgi:hypothetical protein
MKKRTPIIWRSKKEQIIWHIINSAIAGILVFVGAFTDGQLTDKELMASLGVSLVIAFTKFQQFWTSQEKMYRPALFHFIH